MTEMIREMGGSVEVNAPVARVVTAASGGAQRAAGVRLVDGSFVEADFVVSTMPLTLMVKGLESAPQPVKDACDRLYYRNTILAYVEVDGKEIFPDNWIYVHSPEVRVGRIQNFGSWSPYMVQGAHTCLGLEFFVNEGDDLWSMDDEALVALGTRELATLGLAPADSVQTGYVVRMPKAYPMYDEGYAANVAVLREWLARHAANVHPVGRNGMHKYNNQDHSMLTAKLAVENILGGCHDVWNVNVEASYHEEKAVRPEGGTGRCAPVLPAPGSIGP
jgi:protoporphyrinogen oxidase